MLQTHYLEFLIMLYAMPAAIVFLITTDALLKDSTTPSDSVEMWVFILIASLIWPLTLPSILRKKAIDWYEFSKTRTRPV